MGIYRFSHVFYCAFVYGKGKIPVNQSAFREIGGWEISAKTSDSCPFRAISVYCLYE